MSLTFHQRDPEAIVRIGGPYDEGSGRGLVILEVRPQAVQLRSALARRVARALGRMADLAEPRKKK